MRGDVHVRFSESAGVKFPRATHLVVLCRDAASAQHVLSLLEQWTGQAGLELHPEKPHLVAYGTGEGFDFLGYHFKQGKRWPSRKSMKKIRATIRAKTPGTNGHSMAHIIETLNPTLRGWFEYFKHTRSWVLAKLDGYVRMRLRSILRKRIKRSGRGRGTDHQRWPNAYFAAHGLYALEQAHERTLQSSMR